MDNANIDSAGQGAPLPQAPQLPQGTVEFTPERQVAFLDALADWGNVGAAAKAVGISRAHACRMRRMCPKFKRMWDAARLIAVSAVEDELADRALNGVEESVFHHGEEVATRKRFDASLLLAHLARLDNLGTKFDVIEPREDFERCLQDIRNPHGYKG